MAETTRCDLVRALHITRTMRIKVWFVAVSLLTACASDSDAPMDDDENASFTGGKADSAIAEGTPEAIGVLRAAMLPQAITRVGPQAGIALAAYLDGADGRAGTADDGDAHDDRADGLVFDSLAELDAIPYVGPGAFQQLLTLARAQGLVRETPDVCLADTQDVLAAAGELGNNLSALTSDGELTLADLDFVAVQTAALPRRGSPGARALLSTLRPGITVNDAARTRLSSMLRGRWGYDVPAHALDADEQERVIALNVTEPNKRLRCLSALAEAGEETETVAVLDSGFDLDHPALATRLHRNAAEVPDNGIDDDHNGLVDDVAGWDFQGTGDVDAQHGTHVGAIAIQGSQRIRLLPLRIAAGGFSSGAGKGLRVAAAIDYAAAQGARVVNISQSLPADEFAPVRAALERHPDVFVAWAAGNTGASITSGSENARVMAEAHLPNVIIVAAAMPDGTLADYSTFGAPLVDVATLGDRLSAVPPGADGAYYGMEHGTSQAAPGIANLAASCLILDASLSPTDLKTLFAGASDPSGAWTGKVAAGGIVNASRALRAAALTGLIARGVAADRAADSLLLWGDERTAVFRLVAQLGRL